MKGVYKTGSPTNKYYVGQSRDINKATGGFVWKYKEQE